jgi:hypothetical protein
MTDTAHEQDELGSIGAVLRYALNETMPEQRV